MTPSTVEEARRRCPICNADYICGHAVFKPIAPHQIEAQGSEGGESDYTARSFADLRTVISRFVEADPDFPNYADWPITLPAGHWRAIKAALTRPDPSLGRWSWDLSRIPSEPVEVAFDGGLGMCNVRICSARRIGPGSVNGNAVQHDLERGYFEEARPDLNLAGTGWRPYAWRAIQIPSRTPEAPSPPSLGMEGVRKALERLADQCEAEFMLDGKWVNSGQLVSHYAYKAARQALASISTPSGEVG